MAGFKSINVSFAFFKMIVPFIIDTKQLLVLIQGKVQDFGSKNRHNNLFYKVVTDYGRKHKYNPI